MIIKMITSGGVRALRRLLPQIAPLKQPTAGGFLTPVTSSLFRFRETSWLWFFVRKVFHIQTKFVKLGLFLLPSIPNNILWTAFWIFDQRIYLGFSRSQFWPPLELLFEHRLLCFSMEQDLKKNPVCPTKNRLNIYHHGFLLINTIF